MWGFIRNTLRNIFIQLLIVYTLFVVLIALGFFWRYTLHFEIFALIIAIIGEVRHDKAEKKLPLNAPVKKLIVYAGSEENAKVICSASGDIAGTLKLTNIEVLAEKRSEGRQVSSYDVFIEVEY